MTYNRKNFIDSCNFITPFEFELLPENVQLAYLDTIYSYSVKRAREKGKNGDVFNCRGYVHPDYEMYFEKNGCTVTNYDFGFEEYEVKCVDPNKGHKVTEEDKNKLDYYLSILGEAKANIFEGYLNRTFYAGTKNNSDIEVEFTDEETTNLFKKFTNRSFMSIDELTNEEKKMLMEAELSLVIEDIRNGETPECVNILPKGYKIVLNEEIEALNLALPEGKRLRRV